MRPCGLTHEEGPEVVDVEHPAELLDRECSEHAGVVDTGVVDDSVDPAKRVNRLVHDGFCATLIGDRHMDGCRDTAGVFDILDDFFCRPRRRTIPVDADARVGHDNVGAFRREK